MPRCFDHPGFRPDSTRHFAEHLAWDHNEPSLLNDMESAEWERDERTCDHRGLISNCECNGNHQPGL